MFRGRYGELPSSSRRRGCGDERPEDRAGEWPRDAGPRDIVDPKVEMRLQRRYLFGFVTSL